MRAFAASVILFLLASLCAASQGLTITSKVSDDEGKTSIRTSYLSDDGVRTPAGNFDFIFDTKSGNLTTIDHGKKTYYITTQKDFEAISERIREAMNSPEVKRMHEQMNSMPPEQRKQIEASMRSMFTVDVQKLGTSRTIAGYKCDNWMVTVGPSKSEECVTTAIKLPAHAWDMYKAAFDSLKTMRSAIGPMAGDASSMQEQLKKIKGLPLATKTTVSIMGQSRTNTNEVTDIKNGAIPASAFEVPAGYTKVDNPMLKMGR